MVRRSFRLGLWVGLLFGIGFALFKTMQARRAVQDTVPPPGRDPWPPVTRVEPVAERPQPGPVPKPEPEPVVVEADEEPILAPIAAEEPEAAAPQPHLEIVPAPAAALEEQTAPSPPGMVPSEPAEVTPSGLRLVPRPADEPAPAKAPAKKAAAKKAAAKKATPPAPKWVEPVSADMCPETHPIKAKLSSKLFHLPGMFAYPRTKPDRCYDTEQSAIADGLTKAKR